MAANQNVTQLFQQTGTANTSSLFYAVTNGTTDTGLPLSVLVNSLGLTGTPTTPTATTGTNTTQIASTAFVQAQLTSSLAAYAPLAGATFSGNVTITKSTAALLINDSSGSGSAILGFQNNGTSEWTFSNTSTGNQLVLNRFVGGVFQDSPIAIVNATGNVIFADAISPSTTKGIIGTTLGDSAVAGSVGEYVTNTTSGTSLANNTPANATSVSLTAGDWEVSGSIQFSPAASTTISDLNVSINTISATLGGLGFQTDMKSSIAAGSGSVILATPVVRINISSTTTVYLVADQSFAASTMTCNGFIRARRVR